MPEYDRDVAFLLISTTLSAIMILAVCRRLNKLERDVDEIISSKDEAVEAFRQGIFDTLFEDIVEHYDE